MTPDEIRVGFDWQPSEHAEFVQLMVQDRFRIPGWRHLRLGLAVIGVGWLGVGVFDWLASGDLRLLLAGLPWLLMITFWVWLVTRGVGTSAARQAPRLNADLHYPIVHRFDREGMTIEGFASTLALRWDGMLRAKEEDGFFVFYWSPGTAYFTPKRAISLEAQNALRALAQRELGADADMRPRIDPLSDAGQETKPLAESSD